MSLRVLVVDDDATTQAFFAQAGADGFLTKPLDATALADTMGVSLSGLLHQRVADGGKVRAFDSALQEARELRIDMQYQPRSGAAYWTVIELHPIREPDRQRLIGHAVVQIDIDSQRQERLVTLRALRDRQAVLDILDKHALVTETDLRGVITRANPRFAHISGYSEAELLGQKHSIVSSGKHEPAFWATI